MTTVLITGDRSMSPAYGPLVAVEMLSAVTQGKTILTGDTDRGIDALVATLAERAGVEVTKMPDSTPADEVVYIHADPHSSSRIKPLLNDDMMRIVTLADRSA